MRNTEKTEDESTEMKKLEYFHDKGLQRTFQDFSDRILPALENPAPLLEQLPGLSPHGEELIQLGKELRSVLDFTQGVDSLCAVLSVLHSSAEGDRRADKRKKAMVYRNTLLAALGRIGIEILGAGDLVGTPFDPTWQRAIKLVSPSKKSPNGTVARLHAYGARIDGRVIRSALVIVAANSSLKGEPS